MKLPGRRKAAPPPPAPLELETALEEMDLETALLTACRRADSAAQALAAALAERRAARGKLVARTGHAGLGALNRLLSPSVAWAALWAAGAGEALGLPGSMRAHRLTFEASAAGAIENSRQFRRPPPPSPLALPAPTPETLDA